MFCTRPREGRGRGRWVSKRSEGGRRRDGQATTIMRQGVKEVKGKERGAVVRQKGYEMGAESVVADGPNG